MVQGCSRGHFTHTLTDEPIKSIPVTVPVVMVTKAHKYILAIKITVEMELNNVIIKSSVTQVSGTLMLAQLAPLWTNSFKDGWRASLNADLIACAQLPWHKANEDKWWKQHVTCNPAIPFSNAVKLNLALVASLAFVRSSRTMVTECDNAPQSPLALHLK